jgi:hypothetical protein
MLNKSVSVIVIGRPCTSTETTRYNYLIFCIKLNDVANS